MNEIIRQMWEMVRDDPDSWVKRSILADALEDFGLKAGRLRYEAKDLILERCPSCILWGGKKLFQVWCDEKQDMERWIILVQAHSQEVVDWWGLSPCCVGTAGCETTAVGSINFLLPVLMRWDKNLRLQRLR